MPYAGGGAILMECPWEGRMAERPMIDLKPTEFRRLPKIERWALWYGLAGGIALLVFMLATTGWPWLLAAQIGAPVLIIGASLALLTSHLQ